MIDFSVVRGWSLPTTAAFVFAGFFFAYFAFGGFGWWLTRSLAPRLGWGEKLNTPPLAHGQLTREMRDALASIAVFAGWGVLTLYAERRGWVTIDWQPRWGRVPFELIALFVWNELHFYAIHRLLHTRWLFKHVHRQHHKSLQATPFSGYAMHPVESVLLGSVMFTLMLVLPLSPVSMMLFPMVILTFNVLGHLSYDLAPGTGEWNLAAATRRHALHHSRFTGNFGFLLPVLDRWGGTAIPRA